jgi:hypothetical protein
MKFHCCPKPPESIGDDDAPRDDGLVNEYLGG